MVFHMYKVFHMRGRKKQAAAEVTFWLLFASFLLLLKLQRTISFVSSARDLL